MNSGGMQFACVEISQKLALRDAFPGSLAQNQTSPVNVSVLVCISGVSHCSINIPLVAWWYRYSNAKRRFYDRGFCRCGEYCLCGLRACSTTDYRFISYSLISWLEPQSPRPVFRFVRCCRIYLGIRCCLVPVIIAKKRKLPLSDPWAFPKIAVTIIHSRFAIPSLCLNSFLLLLAALSWGGKVTPVEAIGDCGLI